MVRGRTNWRRQAIRPSLQLQSIKSILNRQNMSERVAVYRHVSWVQSVVKRYSSHITRIINRNGVCYRILTLFSHSIYFLNRYCLRTLCIKCMPLIPVQNSAVCSRIVAVRTQVARPSSACVTPIAAYSTLEASNAESVGSCVNCCITPLKWPIYPAEKNYISIIWWDMRSPTARPSFWEVE